MTEVYPDFVGQPRSQVDEFCKEFKCVVVVEEQVDNTKNPGTVISQSRTKGSDVVEGATITIVVSKLEEKDLVPLDGDNTESTESSSEETSN
jgi:beta-lactam-binding protein with PASTA domain